MYRVHSALFGVGQARMTEETYATNVFDECEIHENCTVEIWRNSKTGEISIGWYENKKEES